MAIQFVRAARQRAFLKIALMGPSGSGKTWGALTLARGLAGPGGRIAAIDTENGSMSLYAHLTDFDVVDLQPPFSPERYLEVIHAAEAAGYDVLVIDSFSHAWKQILDEKSALDARGGNQFANWRGPKARMERLKDAVLQTRMHVVCALRAKTDYIQNDRGAYQKAGMAAIGEPDVEYEFTTVFDIGPDHRALAGIDGRGKDRTGLFGPLGPITLAESHGRMLADWLAQAPAAAPVPAPAAAPAAQAVAAAAPPDPDAKAAGDWFRSVGGTADQWRAIPAEGRAALVLEARAVGCRDAGEVLAYVEGGEIPADRDAQADEVAL